MEASAAVLSRGVQGKARLKPAPTNYGTTNDYRINVNFAIALVPLPNGHSSDPLLGRAVRGRGRSSRDWL